MVLLQYISSDLTRFVYPENIVVDTRIVIICLLELDILARLNFQLRLSIRISEQKLHNIQDQRYEAILYNRN